jgi:hypothetical protein
MKPTRNQMAATLSLCACGSSKIVGVYRWHHRLGLYPDDTGPVCAECLECDAKGFDFEPVNPPFADEKQMILL